MLLQGDGGDNDICLFFGVMSTTPTTTYKRSGGVKYLGLSVSCWLSSHIAILQAPVSSAAADTCRIQNRANACFFISLKKKKNCIPLNSKYESNRIHEIWSQKMCYVCWTPDELLAFLCFIIFLSSLLEHLYRLTGITEFSFLFPLLYCRITVKYIFPVAFYLFILTILFFWPLHSLTLMLTLVFSPHTGFQM